MAEILDKYVIKHDQVRVGISIYKEPDKFVPTYHLMLPKLERATLAFLEDVRDKLIARVPIRIDDLRDPSSLEAIKKRIFNEAQEIIKEGLPDIPKEVLDFSATFLVNEMVGLGNIEFLLSDENLEEVVINNSKEPVWVYHKKYGWLLSNIIVDSEDLIRNYASIIGRRIGKQITVLNPLMDAHLLSGDRVNATLFPVSTKGNTITIRKFRRKPWTITDFIENKTLTYETAAFLWLCIQYELSVIIAGGTASGKTSLLNTLLPFIPPSQRIISIEETRELNLPRFLHWVPLTTRSPNPEGKGEVTMLDLLVNSLRMRPDRIVVGEVRRQSEAEVLFEALNTGHSVYATFHANTSKEAFRRLTSPPIDLPPDLIKSLPLFAVMFRQRRLNIRRLFEVSEVIPEEKVKINTIFKWDARKDLQEKEKEPKRVLEELRTFTGMNKEEISEDLKEKVSILKWMVKNKINTINTVGKVISEYYVNRKRLLKNIKDPKGINAILGNYIGELES
ncbi:MAG: CpaF family protein [Nanoarchaeota archaeon]|nr:CpaF family protein [Nanoarchaeota archaeon]